MGHDISGCNNAGKEVAYARFSMGNYNAIILYSLLDAEKYYAGVSGTGESSIFTFQQMEEALNACNQLFDSSVPQKEMNWDQKQIQDFILNCLETAQKEGSVKVFFC
ncbi:hypothetical protein [Bacillus sp. B15-48]|uniref:hypothetical protein n=1 Tax=Bacillus sp. B15-48 TaxID=1548601 RepID=UPI00193F88C3|nr:hypothetical protein [Bacillus sp. B15-48]MBM4764821.1 hypothetical protein [Bacillus sp. B15-48]